MGFYKIISEIEIMCCQSAAAELCRQECKIFLIKLQFKHKNELYMQCYVQEEQVDYYVKINIVFAICKSDIFWFNFQVTNMGRGAYYFSAKHA